MDFMQIGERAIQRAGELAAIQGEWLAIRQPAVFRYLAERCGEASELLGYAVDLSCRLELAFEQSGVRVPRLKGDDLSGADDRMDDELSGKGKGADSFIHRQPALAEFILHRVADPPILVDERERGLLLKSMATVLLAFDSCVAT